MNKKLIHSLFDDFIRLYAKISRIAWKLGFFR